MDQPYLSSTEAAQLLGMSLGAFRMAIVRGHLVPTGRLGKRLLWSVEDLHRQVRQHVAKIASRSLAIEERQRRSRG